MNAFVQTPRSVVMIRPHHFAPNVETARDNAFQTEDASRSTQAIAEAAYAEVTMVVQKLEAAGVTVHLFEDETADTPIPSSRTIGSRRTAAAISRSIRCSPRAGEGSGGRTLSRC